MACGEGSCRGGARFSLTSACVVCGEGACGGERAFPQLRTCGESGGGIMVLFLGSARVCARRWCVLCVRWDRASFPLLWACLLDLNPWGEHPYALLPLPVTQGTSSPAFSPPWSGETQARRPLATAWQSERLHFTVEVRL